MPSFDRDGLGKIAWEINIQSLGNGKPVGNKLEGDNVKETL